jgi:DNA polymerase/3'-5' exonuclease PolX
MNRNIIENFINLLAQVKAEYLNAQVEGDPKEITRQEFRLKSIKSSLNALRQVDFKIKSAKDLKGIPKIGPGTIKRVQEILDTGTLAELKHKYTKEKQNKIDAISEIESVIGIGPQLAKKLVLEHGIYSVKDLKKAVKSGKIKANEKIKLGLKYYGVVKGNIRRTEMKQIEKYLKKELAKIDPSLQLIICGSYRRGKKTSGDIDALIYTEKMPTLDSTRRPERYGAKPYLEDFVNHLIKIGFLVDSMTNKNYTTNYMGFCKFDDDPVRRIDLKLVPMNALHTATLYFTGPYELNTDMRLRAKKRGMLLNQYGLYKEEPDGMLVKLKINSEKDVFDKLGMPYLTPKERENYSEGKISKALKK